MSINNYVDYILTIDSDLIAFGSKKILYNLQSNGSCKEINHEDVIDSFFDKSVKDRENKLL